MARILRPPAPLDLAPGAASVFLAGSIEMGRATNWQSTVEAALAHSDLTVLNPRREAWDSSWEQRSDNPLFRGQVDWELEAQERASLIAMYFAPGTQAPITLLELGLFARSGRLVVCCPEGFWRKGNVDIVCMRYDVPQVPDLDALIAAILQGLPQ
ncbi:MAG: hypothetical protein OHK0022_52010 [Roseiflexaceae bacterium]